MAAMCIQRKGKDSQGGLGVPWGDKQGFQQRWLLGGKMSDILKLQG